MKHQKAPFQPSLFLSFTWALFLLAAASVASVSIAFAKGGGGGSGSAMAVASPQCDDSGMFVFSKATALRKVIVLQPDGAERELVGEWDSSTFTSEEAELNQSGKHFLRDPSGDQEFTCPGLVFSCRLASLSIKSCRRKAKSLIAEFSLEHGSPEYLLFQLRKQDKKILKFQQGVSSSKELINPKITKSGDSYIFTVDEAPEGLALQISLQPCVGRYYVYSTIVCAADDAGPENAGSGLSGKSEETSRSPNGTPQEIPKETPGSKEKCGGYMGLEDRVRCRLSLREEQEDEYENFYPEECKAMQGSSGPAASADCLKGYRAVQQCWKSPAGPARIACVRKQAALGSIKEEKRKCQALPPAERGSCISGLEKKAHSVIKFRLYNLEEEAEWMMEKGWLSKEDVVSFVVKMEQSKLEYNLAKSKAERKKLIEKAKRDWNGLMDEVEVKQ
ncbi:hypothetical protein HYU14_06800 [Candidatus Woesearchaeota archaeon]|nr:hypothetical protein [Candidatus Woesearchaeota archaeon]